MLVPPSVNSEVTINVGPSWRRRQRTSSTPNRESQTLNLCGPQRSRSCNVESYSHGDSPSAGYPPGLLGNRFWQLTGGPERSPTARGEDHMTTTATPSTGRWTPGRIAIWTGGRPPRRHRLGRPRPGRGESINAVWLIVAALCSYAIAYRFYARFIASQGARGRRQPRHAGRAARQRPGLPADRQVGAVRPPLRRHRRRRPAGRPGAGRAVRLPAGHDLDHRRA